MNNFAAYVLLGTVYHHNLNHKTNSKMHSHLV